MSAAPGPAVVVGAGAVGLGVLVPLLDACGQDAVVVARTRQQARQLRGDGNAALAVTQGRRLRELVASAAAVVVAVRPHQLAEVGRAVAPALSSRTDPVAVLVCDNREDAAAALRACVLEHGDVGAKQHAFAGVLVDHIARRAGSGGRPTVLAEAHGRVLVDRGPVRDLGRAGTPLLASLGLEPVDDFRDQVVAKRHVFSAGHAAAAYVGLLLGHRDMAAAVGDGDVAEMARAVMREGQHGLEAARGAGAGGGEDAVERCLERFADPALADTTVRVARDPLRKLRRDDRVLGPALLARRHGVATPALQALAAAVVLVGRADPVLGRELARHGVEGVLHRHGGLPPDHPFVVGTVATVRALAVGAALPPASRPRIVSP